MKTKRSILSVILAVLLSFTMIGCGDDTPAAPTPSEVTISKTSATLKVGETLDLTASVKYSDGSTTSDIVWSSSDSAVATVENGKVTAIKIGGATVTASSSADATFKASCQITVNQEPKVTMSNSSLDMVIGDNETLTATVTMADGSVNTDVTWSSSNTSAATVSSDGVVNAVGYGTAIIYAASTGDASLKGVCEVSVSYEPRIELNPNKASLILGGAAVTLTATVRLGNGTTNSRVNWSSSNGNVAVSGGVVSAVSIGTATVTATSQDIPTLSADCIITVKGEPTIEISKSEMLLGLGERFTLTATAILADGSEDEIDWLSLDTDVATVSGGVVRGVNVGKTTIKATARNMPSLSKTCAVEVTNRGISISPSTVTMIQGDDPVQLTANIVLEGAENLSVTWSVESGDSVTVVEGLVTAIASGVSVVKATSVADSTLSKTCTVTVLAPKSLTLSRQEALMIMGGGELRLQAKALYTGNVTSDRIIWESSESDKVSVNNGVLKPIAVGSSTITAKVPNGTGFLSAACIIDVLADTTGLETYTEGGMILTLRNANVNDTLCYSVKAESKTVSAIEIPASKNRAPVSIIEENAFKDCTALNDFVLGANIVYIGSNAFRNANVKSNLTLNNNTKMADYAFAKSKFAQVTISEGTTVVPLGAFEAAALNKIVFSKSLVEIKSYAFANCENLTTADMSNTSLEMIGTERVGTKLGNSFFSCYALVNVGKLPDTLKEIGFATFLKCPKLTTITLGNDLRKIGGQAFMQCARIPSMSIPESVRVIGEGAFNMWGGDQTVVVPYKSDDLPLGYHFNWKGDGSKAKVTYNV